MIKVVVPISGGKDSQAALKLALQNYPANEVRGLFCDTKWEHPLTYAHVEWMRKHFGVEIDTACGGSMLEKVIKHGRWPGGGARHCTDELKIRLTKKYCTWLALLEGRGFEVWYGLHALLNLTHRRKRVSNELKSCPVCSEKATFDHDDRIAQMDKSLWRVRDLLKKIACKTQTENLHWWQIDARLALAEIDAAMQSEAPASHCGQDAKGGELCKPGE